MQPAAARNLNAGGGAGFGGQTGCGLARLAEDCLCNDDALTLRPDTPQELTDALRGAAARGARIRLEGAGSKRGFGGPRGDADVEIRTSALQRVIEYNPQDLTVSVEAGLAWAELERLLAENRQAIPLDPPLAARATVGGVVASGLCGPRRFKTGAVRDLVIGMEFATLEGKRIRAGGMVVKNVAGLDMGKLMIGSWGTLAALLSVNFKLIPMPPLTRTFVAEGIRIEPELRGLLQPLAYDILRGGGGTVTAFQCGGSAAMMDRAARELAGWTTVEDENGFWRRAREFAPEFLAAHPDGVVVRVPCLLTEIPEVLGSLPGSAVARAGNGIVYGAFEDAGSALAWIRAQSRPLAAEAAPDAFPLEARWTRRGGDFALMEKIKTMFDPRHQLNKGRLYGHI
jgi:glycolate oxidase FAD binding subunit